MAGISDPGYNSGDGHHFAFCAASIHSLEQVIADAQRIRDDRQRRIHRAA